MGSTHNLKLMAKKKLSRQGRSKRHPQYSLTTNDYLLNTSLSPNCTNSLEATAMA